MHKCTESIVISNRQFVVNQINLSIQAIDLFFFKNMNFAGILASSRFTFKLSSLVSFCQDVLDAPANDDEISELYLTSSSYPLVLPSQYI